MKTTTYTDESFVFVFAAEDGGGGGGGQLDAAASSGVPAVPISVLANSMQDRRSLKVPTETTVLHKNKRHETTKGDM